MPVMKIRGGDLDLVEYEFRTFVPGTNIKTLGYDKRKYKLTPFEGTVHVVAPARIHLTVLDMNRFAPDHPGGGGSGLPSSATALLRSSVPAVLWKSIIQGSQSSAIL